MDAYNAFSSDYDKFVDWESRLRFELPLIERLARYRSKPQRILDAACGTGMHAIALAQIGHETAGADLSVGMIERARLNAAERGVAIRFEAVGFGELGKFFTSYDMLLCLGNSLPHVLDLAGVELALKDFASCLKPGGLALIQNRNFDAVMAARQRWVEPQSHRQSEAEWIFLRFYDYEPDGLINFNILTLHRTGEGRWEQSVTSTRLRPLLQAELVGALAEAGFEKIECFGSMGGEPFDPERSGNLVVAARSGE